MQLFYNPDISENTNTLQFSKEESKHITKVLRKKTGDILHITNGQGWLFQATIINDDVKNCIANVTVKEKKERQNAEIHIAVAPTKINDRFEWFLEKATELGVNTITPILCEHSERKIIKLERFERIILAAMKQSLQCYLPKLNRLTPYTEFIDLHPDTQKFIAHCEDSNKYPLHQSITPKEDLLIIIGPEGDFSKAEIDNALERGYLPVSLGETRLRTETAAIVAVHTAVLANHNKG